MPAGVLNVVTGPPAPIGDVLVENWRVAKFNFTGSTRLGKALAARCLETQERVSLELGGNAPFIVFDDADLDAAVLGVMASKFRNAGQTCVPANRLLVQEGVSEVCTVKLASAVAALPWGEALDGDVPIGPLISAAAVEKADAHVQDGVLRGGRVIVGGEQIEGPGYFFAPTVLSDVPVDTLLCREEMFGPGADIVCFEAQVDAIRIFNDIPVGLAAYAFTHDLSRSHRVTEALEYGIVGFNTVLIATEVAPFGGIKNSGFGREGGAHGIEDYFDMNPLRTLVEPQ